MVGKSKGKLFLFFITAVIIFQGTNSVSEQHSQEIIFADTINNVDQKK
jgi:hypothetical protein